MDTILERFKKQRYLPETALPWDWKLYLEDIFVNLLVCLQREKAYDDKTISNLKTVLNKIRET